MKKHILILALTLTAPLLYGQTYVPAYSHKQALTTDIQFLEEKVVAVLPLFFERVKRQ